MSANIVNLGSPMHQNVQDLLPWFVMGSLDDDDRTVVDEHLLACAACRRDMEWHRQVRAAHAAPASARDVDRAFAALQARLPASIAKSPAVGWLSALRAWWQAQQPWARYAFALQPVLILGLAGALLFGPGKSVPEEPGLFHALGRPTAALAAARLVVVFAPQTTQVEMRRVLLASGTRIVDGPTAADAYILAVAPERAEQAAQQLRSEHSVLLIQALDARSAH